MSLVFAAMTPHPPFLIPNIGKEKLTLLKHTQEAMERLEQELYICKPSIIVIITPHGSLFPDAFSMNGHTSFQASFDAFGDVLTQARWTGAPELASRITHSAKKSDIPVQLVSQEALDHGASIPLYYLTKHIPDVRILPVGYSRLTPEAHVRFGGLIQDVLLQSGKRIAVIASGDLSHEDGGDVTSGKLFDDKLRVALEEERTGDVLALAQQADKVHECGYRSLLILLGVLGHAKFQFETYAAESPFGVSYLTGNFHV